MPAGRWTFGTVVAAALAAAALFSITRETATDASAGKATQTDQGPEGAGTSALGEGREKAWTLREAVALGRSRDAAAVPELRRLALTSEDPLVAGNAVRALGRLGAVAKDRELVALIDDGRPRVRQETVVALGLSSERSLVDRVARLLESDDATVRRLAIQALGRLGGDRARARIESLLRALGTSDIDRAFARAALRQG